MRQARQIEYSGGRTGSVTVIQRASSDLRVNPHFHAIVLDGAYVPRPDSEPPVFVETPKPADEEVKKLVETVATRVIRFLVRRGILDENSCAVDRLVEKQPVLADLLQASVLGAAATGQRAGQRIRRVLSDPAPGQRTGDLCFASRGFSLHAAHRVSADQRDKLEELLRYEGLPSAAPTIAPARAPPQVEIEFA